jgi:hypothetical protein
MDHFPSGAPKRRNASSIHCFLRIVRYLIALLNGDREQMARSRAGETERRFGRRAVILGGTRPGSLCRLMEARRMARVAVDLAQQVGQGERAARPGELLERNGRTTPPRQVCHVEEGIMGGESRFRGQVVTATMMRAAANHRRRRTAVAKAMMESAGSHTLDMMGCERIVAAVEERLNELPEQEFTRWVTLDNQFDENRSFSPQRTTSSMSVKNQRDLESSTTYSRSRYVVLGRIHCQPGVHLFDVSQQFGGRRLSAYPRVLTDKRYRWYAVDQDHPRLTLRVVIDRNVDDHASTIHCR